MPTARQPFLHAQYKPRLEHGGATRAGRRKEARPIDPKRPLHIVLRSSHARGERSFLSRRHAKSTQALLLNLAAQHGVRIYELANSGNHIHLLLRTRTRRGLQNFLRTAAGRIAQLVTGARKGHAFGKFWDDLVYSRVVEWGKAFWSARKYVLINEMESKTGRDRSDFVAAAADGSIRKYRARP